MAYPPASRLASSSRATAPRSKTASTSEHSPTIRCCCCCGPESAGALQGSTYSARGTEKTRATLPNLRTVCGWRILKQHAR
ncbi:hypothetical protein FOCC_FOCC015072 [Frankliniella occidentalis]|nr:hypothetical protein FOCC_FOCC015072 [Frankliniella occidentalis]